MTPMRVRAISTDLGNLVGRVIASALALTTSIQADAHGTGPSPAMNEHDQHDFPRAVYQFHQVLAPLWHSQPGRDRVDAACNQVPQLHTLAKNIASAAVPERALHDRVGWSEAVKDMIVSIDQLSRACSNNGSADAEAALVAAQRAFHDMVAYLGHGH
jgi:hypothetical protein